MNAANRNRLRNKARKAIGRVAADAPSVRKALMDAETWVERQRHTLHSTFPGLIRPRPARLFLSLTGRCNWRCEGCRYERDFMVGEQLTLDVVKGVLEDARDAGIHRVRLYGGEPLLHPDLTEIVAYCRQLGRTEPVNKFETPAANIY